MDLFHGADCLLLAGNGRPESGARFIGHGRTNVNNTDTRGDRVALHVAVTQIDENCAKTSIPVPSGIPLARLGQTEATQTVGPTHAQLPLRARVAFRRRDPYAFLLPCFRFDNRQGA